jgi:hypothetical protein
MTLRARARCGRKAPASDGHSVIGRSRPALMPCRARLQHGVLGGAGGDAVGHHQHLGVVGHEILGLEDVGARFLGVELGVDALLQLVDQAHVLGRQALAVVIEPGEVRAVALAEGRQRRHAGSGLAEGLVVLRGARRIGAVDDGHQIERRQHQRLLHLADLGVRQQHYRGAVLLGDVEGAHRLLPALLRGGRGDGDDGVVAVGAPARLHHVGLADVGGAAGRRPAAHDVDDDEGDFQDAGVAEVLLLEREARAGGAGEGLDAAQRRPDGRGDAGDLVLHLQVAAAVAHDVAGRVFQHLGGGRDRIAAEEARPGFERRLGDGVVAAEGGAPHLREAPGLDGLLHCIHPAQVDDRCRARRRRALRLRGLCRCC